MTELTIDAARRAFFTPETPSSYLQVSDRLIRKWVAEGCLRSYKLDGCRRFDPADVDRFVSQFRDRRAPGSAPRQTPYRRTYPDGHVVWISRY